VHRPAEQPALAQIRTDRARLIGHLLGLDTLGDHDAALQVGELGERPGDGVRTRLVQPGDQRLAELDDVGPHDRHQRQAGPADPDVVQRHPPAQ
jgi:hypothetical protein